MAALVGAGSRRWQVASGKRDPFGTHPYGETENTKDILCSPSKERCVCCHRMPWKTLDFGKHEGSSLPQVLFRDPDWFFWAHGEGILAKRPLYRREAEAIYARATSIRIRQDGPERLRVEYLLQPTDGRFAGFEIVEESRPAHHGTTRTHRADHIDMSFPCRLVNYDKLGCAILVGDLKNLFFSDESIRMTRKRCEAFFDDLSHFHQQGG